MLERGVGSLNLIHTLDREETVTLTDSSGSNKHIMNKAREVTHAVMTGCCKVGVEAAATAQQRDANTDKESSP